MFCVGGLSQSTNSTRPHPSGAWQNNSSNGPPKARPVSRFYNRINRTKKKRGEASRAQRVKEKSHSHSGIIKLALARFPPTEMEDQQPTLKRLKGAALHMVEDIDSSDEDSDAMSAEDFSQLPPSQNTKPRTNSPTKNQILQSQTTVKQSSKAKTPLTTTQQKENNEPQTLATERKERIPRIILHQNEKWTVVCQKLGDSNIKFSKAKSISEGTSIHSCSSNHIRSTIDVLNKLKADYHYYQLPSESNGFHPESVTRLRRYKEKISMALVWATEDRKTHLSSGAHSQPRHYSRIAIAQDKYYPMLQVPTFRPRAEKKPKCVNCAGNHHYAKIPKKPNPTTKLRKLYVSPPPTPS